SEILPQFASCENPIDITAQLLNDKHLLSDALPILMKDPNVDTILFGLGIIGKGYDIDSILNDIINSQQAGDKMVGVAWVGSGKGRTIELNANNVPAFDDPSLCIKAMSKYTEYCLSNTEAIKESSEEQKDSKKNSFNNLLQTHNGFLSENDSKFLLKEALPVPKSMLFTNEEEIKQSAPNLEYPVVMKINSAEIQHKTEVEGVKLNIS